MNSPVASLTPSAVTSATRDLVLTYDGWLPFGIELQIVAQVGAAH
jgi:hypothetical protein